VGHARSADEEAALWVVRLADPECDARLHQAFETWRSADPRHAAAYAALEATWHATHRAAPALQPRKRRSATWRALALLLCLVGLARVGMGFDESFQTAGHTTSVVLSDGSHLALNANSAAVVRMGWWSRTLTLTRGEALFDVADDWRGFALQAAGARLTDIGTRFNVRLVGGQGEVAVIEGAVEVAAGSARTLLHAGQRSRFSAGSVGPAEPVHASADAWLSGRWVFAAVTLDEIADELYRHHGQRVSVSPALASVRVSGVFSTHDHAGLLQALPILTPVRIESHPDGIRILPRT
jgi:transmembrane sensor